MTLVSSKAEAPHTNLSIVYQIICKITMLRACLKSGIPVHCKRQATILNLWRLYKKPCFLLKTKDCIEL